MVKQEPFLLQQFADSHQHEADFTVTETCCSATSISDLETITGERFSIDNIAKKQLGYGWMFGSDELKKEISNIYESIQIDNLVITHGGIGANYLTFYSLVQPGDHVIVVDPCYQQLSSLPQVFGAEVDKWIFSESNDWQPDLNELEIIIKSNTKLIVLSSPNNPTGAFISIEDLNKIIELARKNDIFILSDEVYRPLFHSTPANEIPKSIADLYEKGISTGSMSKAFALPGLRLGWIASKYKPFIDDCIVKRDYNTISVSPINDIVATYALKNKDLLLKRNSEICLKNLEIIKGIIKSSEGKLEVFIPSAGTTCFIKVNGVSNTEQLCLFLIKKYKSLFIPGETFGYPGYLRVGFGSSENDLTVCMENLLKHIQTK